jgi:hypothetical protein
MQDRENIKGRGNNRTQDGLGENIWTKEHRGDLREGGSDMWIGKQTHQVTDNIWWRK